MLCDELKTFDVGLGQYSEDGSPCVVAFVAGRNPRLLNEKIYLKSEVDAAIAELKAEIRRKEGVEQRWFERCMEERTENAELKKKLENVQASMHADVVDANMENRRLKRALWIARAKRAQEKIAWFKLWNASISTMNPEDGARQEFDKWKRNLGKFLKKAEEYK